MHYYHRNSYQSRDHVEPRDPDGRVDHEIYGLLDGRGAHGICVVWVPEQKVQKKWEK